MTASLQRRAIIAAVLALALAMAMLVAGAVTGGSAAHAADDSVCNFAKKVYCDGFDDAEEWDGIDDKECYRIPGVAWNNDTDKPRYKNGRPDYSGVKGKVYWYNGSQYVLVHDSTPKAKPKKKPATTAPSSKPKAETKSSTKKNEPKTEQAAPVAEPVAEQPAPPAPVVGSVQVAGSLVPGGTITIAGAGFAPDTTGYRIEVHSEATVLAEVASDESGAFSVTATLPANLPAGAHTVIVFQGDQEVGQAQLAVAAKPGTDPIIGLALIGGLVVVGAAAVGVTTVRRRQQSGAAAT